jgi:hypothetical protein
MTWVKLDDAFAEHPKIARLSDSALALFVVGLAYCNRNLTDGFIPRQVGIGQLRYCDGNTVPPIRELERGGVWEAVPGGWQVHDFDHYQPSRESVLAEREAARERMRNLRSGRSSKDVHPNIDRSSTTPVPVPKEQPAPNGASSESGDVQLVYDHWRTARGKKSSRYNKISTERRRRITARLREFSTVELIRALDAVALDPWEDRPRHDDLTKLFKSREAVDAWLELADKPPSEQRRDNGPVPSRYGRGMTTAGILSGRKELDA